MPTADLDQADHQPGARALPGVPAALRGVTAAKPSVRAALPSVRAARPSVPAARSDVRAVRAALPSVRAVIASTAVGAAATVAAVVGGTAVARWVLPTSPLPRPTGPHPVGTTVTQVDGPRTLPVQVWYPATTNAGDPAPLFPAPTAPDVIAARYGLPAWLLAPLRRIRGNAIGDAPALAAAPRGLVVLVHGWLGFRTIHADLAEQLASDGWVVLAADHVGGALVSQHPDGSATAVDPDLMPPAGAPDYGPRVLALVDRYAEDVTAVLDAADAGMDLPAVGLRVPPAEQVLVVAQSTGGGAAVRAAARDDRIGGIVGLDPWVEPVRRRDRAALRCPMVAVRSGGWVGNGNDRLLSEMPRVVLRTVPTAGHTDLTGLAYLTPLLRLTPLSRCHPSLPHDAALAAVAEVLAASEPGGAPAR